MVNMLPEHQVPYYLRQYVSESLSKTHSSLGFPVGPVEMYNVEELTVSYIRSKSSDGIIYLPVVDLIKSCESRSPSGLLMWIDSLKSFGFYDRKQDILFSINKSPSDVMSDLYKYIHLQWEPDESCVPVDLLEAGAFLAEIPQQKQKIEDSCINRHAWPSRFDLTTRRGRLLRLNRFVILAIRKFKVQHMINLAFYSPIVIIPFKLYKPLEESIIFRHFSKNLLPSAHHFVFASFYFLILFIWVSMNELNDLSRIQKRTWISLIMAPVCLVIAILWKVFLS